MLALSAQSFKGARLSAQSFNGARVAPGGRPVYTRHFRRTDLPATKRDLRLAAGNRTKAVVAEKLEDALSVVQPP